MRMVFGLVLLLGIALAGGAVYMANNYIGAYQAQLAQERASRVPPIELRDIYVATRALRYGDPLTEDAVAAAKWPVTSVPEGAFFTKEEVFSKGSELRVVLRAIEKGEPLLAVKVTEPGEDAGLTARLEKGMRAFAINVDVSSGVSGFLRPGDHVDVYWTGRSIGNGRQEAREITRLIQERVKLIAVDQLADFDSTSANIARTVTVTVTPQEVARLAQAQMSGRLTLALVGAGDDSVAETVDVDQRRLLGVAEESDVAAVEEEEICTIRTRRGAEVVNIPIPCTN